MSNLKCTPLREFHVAHGGRMVDFAGWEMPVQYHSILEEHKTVRRAAGLFDVSHMGEAVVQGPEAGRFLNHLVTNDVARLFPGRVLYTPMCYPSGGVVDDLLVYMRGPEDFFLCFNAGNIDKDLAWMREQAAPFSVAITDRSADYALLAVQGPRAARIVQTLTEAKLDAVKYYHFVDGTVAGVHCLISRSRLGFHFADARVKPSGRSASCIEWGIHPGPSEERTAVGSNSSPGKATSTTPRKQC